MDDSRWKRYPRAHDRERDGELRSQECDCFVEYLRLKPYLTVRHIFGELEGFQLIDGNLHGPCPLHGGRDSSFVVDPRTLRWRCYSACDDGGDPIDFLRCQSGGRLRGHAFVDVLKGMCERVRAELRQTTRAQAHRGCP